MKLNQVVPIWKQVKTRVMEQFNKLHHDSGGIEFFNGFSKVYEPKDAEGEQYPPEKKIVQRTAKQSLATAANLLTELFDVAAQRDVADATARADVSVDGVKVLSAVPAPFLLFLEKQIAQQLRPFVEALPTLDPQYEWSYDTGLGFYRTPTLKNHKTKKVPKVITKAEPTKEHPAQTELVHEDQVVGYWNDVKLSGSLDKPTKDDILKRVDSFHKAVKIAIQEANSSPAPEVPVGKAIFDLILNRK